MYRLHANDLINPMHVPMQFSAASLKVGLESIVQSNQGPNLGRRRRSTPGSWTVSISAPLGRRYRSLPFYLARSYTKRHLYDPHEEVHRDEIWRHKVRHASESDDEILFKLDGRGDISACTPGHFGRATSPKCQACENETILPIPRERWPGSSTCVARGSFRRAGVPPVIFSGPARPGRTCRWD